MVEDGRNPRTIERIYQIVANGDPIVRKELRRAELVLRKVAVEPKPENAFALSHSPALQTDNVSVIFEELGDKTPVDALREAIEREKEEITVFSAEAHASSTPLADKYFSGWHEQKLPEVEKTTTIKAFPKRRQKMTQQKKPKEAKPLKKNNQQEMRYLSTEIVHFLDLEEPTGVGKYTIQNLLKNATVKIRRGKYIYHNKKEAMDIIEAYKKKKAEKSVGKRRTIVPPEGFTNATILSKRFDISVYIIQRNLKHIKVPRATWFSYPEEESIRILTEWKVEKERKEQERLAREKLSRRGFPEGTVLVREMLPHQKRPSAVERIIQDEKIYVTITQLLREGHGTGRKSLMKLLHPASAIHRKSNNGKQLPYYLQDEALAIIRKDQEEKLERKKRRAQRTKKPQGIKQSEISKRYNLNHNTVSKIFRNTLSEKWRNCKFYDENVAKEVVLEYLRTRPNEKGIYIQDNEQFVAMEYFRREYGFTGKTLIKELAEVRVANEPGVNDIELFSLPEAMSRLAHRINTPQTDKKTGIYTDSDGTAWAPRFVFNKTYGFNYEQLDKLVEGLDTTFVRGKTGHIVPAYRISDLVPLLSDKQKKQRIELWTKETIEERAWELFLQKGELKCKTFEGNTGLRSAIYRYYEDGLQGVKKFIAEKAQQL